MGRVATSMVGRAHEYTRSKTPWLLDRCDDDSPATPAGRDGRCRKLFRYLSGGGMKAFGRTVRQEEADMKRGRFLAAFAVAVAVWFCFWI